jgi:hypothetical protein
LDTWSVLRPATAAGTTGAVILRGVHLDFNKYNIRPDAARILDEAAEILGKHPNVAVNVNACVGEHSDHQLRVIELEPDEGVQRQSFGARAGTAKIKIGVDLPSPSRHIPFSRSVIVISRPTMVILLPALRKTPD